MASSCARNSALLRIFSGCVTGEPCGQRGLLDRRRGQVADRGPRAGPAAKRPARSRWPAASSASSVGTANCGVPQKTSLRPFAAFVMAGLPRCRRSASCESCAGSGLRFSALMRKMNSMPSRWSISCWKRATAALRRPSRTICRSRPGRECEPWRRAPPSRECRESSGSLLLRSACLRSKMISGLMSTSFSRGSLPMLRSMTVMRLETPTCGAARPMPCEAYMVSNMSATSLRSSALNSVTGSPGCCEHRLGIFHNLQNHCAFCLKAPYLFDVSVEISFQFQQRVAAEFLAGPGWRCTRATMASAATPAAGTTQISLRS